MKTLILALAMLPALAVAQDDTLGHLTISQPWTRATPPNAQVAAGYVAITNNGPTDDALVMASMEGTKGSMLHQTVVEDGVARMQHKDDIVIPAGETVKLQPGGLHIMAMGLSKTYKIGQTVSGTLTFKHAGILPVMFKVEPMAAMNPEGEGPMPMHH